MTASNNLTNFTLAEAGDSGLWSDWGSGAGSAQDANAPIEGAENRSRRIDNTVRGFSVLKGPVDLSPAGTHFGIWMRTFQPGLTNSLGPRLSGDAGAPDNSPYSQWNFSGSLYPAEGPWLRLWVDPTATRDTGLGTLNLASIQWVGGEFDMANVGGNATNCHIDRIDYGAAGISITGGTLGTPSDLAEAVTLDNANALGIVNDDFLNGPLSIGGANTVFRDGNFALKAGNQPLAASDWIRIDIDNTQATNDVVLGGYFLEGIPWVPNGTAGVIDLGTGTMVGAPAQTWNSAVVFAGKIASSQPLTTGGADIHGATIENPSGTVGVIYDETSDPGGASGDLRDVDFSSDGTGHALELGASSPTAITLTRNVFGGFASANGSTGNEALWIRRTAGTVTITLDGVEVDGSPATSVSYRTDGATVVFVANQTTVTFAGIPNGLEARARKGSVSLDHVASVTGNAYAFTGDPGDKITFSFGGVADDGFSYERQTIDLEIPSNNSTIPLSFELNASYS